MERQLATRLLKRLEGLDRKPIILRGARQVGKTWLVRDLAQRMGRRLVELNFEADPSWKRCFVDNDPAVVLRRISIRTHKEIAPESSLLFLDEVQAFAAGLGKLRWFAEQMPELPVVAAGSLLEFALKDYGGSMPVGRVRFVNLEPLGFEEMLRAQQQEMLVDELLRWRPGKDLDPTAHREAALWMGRFSMVGGMPGIVAADLRGEGLETLRDEQRQLVATYRADFPKYAGRIAGDTMDAVLRSVAGQLGQKFVYARVEDARKQHHVKEALERLVQARLCCVARYASGNGVPLSAETKDKFRKVAFHDVCVLHALLETPEGGMSDLLPSMRARIHEQMTTQQLRLLGSPEGDLRELFYWQREGGRPGEIDHLIQTGGRVIPVELKSGASGSMKSLHQFMFEKGHELAVRIDSNPPSLMDVDVKTTQGNPVRYRLLSLPHHLLFNLARILENL